MLDPVIFIYCYYKCLELQMFYYYSCVTSVDVSLALGHVTTQKKHCFAVNYIIDHSFTYGCISSVLHILYIHNDNYLTMLIFI